MKKNGFTLIELLAVIVILAIIALIATPIVLNIIEESKESATIRGAEYYMDAVELGIIRARLDNTKVEDGIYNILDTGNICLERNDSKCIKELKVDVKGEIPDSGTIRIEEGKLENGFLKYDDNVITKVDDEFIIVSKPESFETDDWITIIANVNVGNIDKYEVGAEKEITLTSTDDDSGNEDGFTTGPYTVRLANKSNDASVCTEKYNAETQNENSKTACGFVIEFVDIITACGMNETDTNAGGWPASELYEFVTEDIYNAIDPVVKNAIIPTTVVSGHESDKTENYTTYDKLYLLAPREVYKYFELFRKDSLTETRLLDYYTSQINIDSNYVAIKELDGEVTGWWLRSTNSEDTRTFFGIPNTTGYIATITSNSDRGVSPAFRLG